jgi:hypothetical protein
MNRWLAWAPWLVAIALAGAGTRPARSTELSTEPILRIEAGMHTARINQIASDGAGRYAATGLARAKPTIDQTIGIAMPMPNTTIMMTVRAMRALLRHRHDSRVAPE